jgi:LPS-assembly protein
MNHLINRKKKLFAVGLPEETISFGLKQYLYDENMKMFFFQRLAQKYYPKREYKPSELENEMQYTWDDWTFYNYALYSHEFSAIHAMISSIELDGERYDVSLGHSYKQYLKKEGNSVAISDLNFDFKYSLNQRVRFDGGFTYDMEHKESKQWRLGIGYFRDCWSIDTSIEHKIRASSSGPEDIRTFYIQLNFIPFGSVGTGDFGVGLEDEY